jgi:hypothetical protein
MPNSRVAGGVSRTTGDVRLSDPFPLDLRLDAEEDDNRIVLFSESYGLRLRADTDVDIIDHGRYGALTPGTIPAYTMVNTYLMHADRFLATTPIVLEGAGVFEERVIGIITENAKLRATDRELGNPDITYPKIGGLTLPGSGADLVHYLTDHRVWTRMVVGPGLDHIRIITAAMDHFLVYRLEKSRPLEEAPTVLLKGQFNDDYVEASINNLTHFANPVEKNGGRINNRNDHFAWYEISQLEDEFCDEPVPGQKLIFIRNQFDTTAIVIGQPRYLLAPAEKTSEPDSDAPAELSHYKCYEVVSYERSEDARFIRPLTLEDQWNSLQDVEVAEALFFCVPVEKKIGRWVWPIQNETDHFTVYSIQTSAAGSGFSAEDQFQLHEFLTGGDCQLLCVPTLKGITIRPVDDGPPRVPEPGDQ